MSCNIYFLILLEWFMIYKKISSRSNISHVQIYFYGRHIEHYNIALGFVLILIFGNALRMGKIIIVKEDNVNKAVIVQEALLM
jgi:hypothetical protein